MKLFIKIVLAIGIALLQFGLGVQFNISTQLIVPFIFVWYAYWKFVVFNENFMNFK